MPSYRGTIFVNDGSGSRMPVEESHALADAAREQGMEVVAIRPGVDIIQTIRKQLGEQRRLFIAAGGDGTVHHVMQPLVNSGASLAVLPIGTYNHFAKDLDIPLDWRAALDVAVNGETRQIDVARVNERYFINNLSIGLYPELVAKREARGRDYPRWKARLFAAFTTLRHYPHVSINIESEHHQEVIRTHVFMVSNNSYDLSRIGIDAPRPTLTEGRLAIYWLPHLSRWALMKFAAHYLAGRVSQAPGFRSFRTQRVKVQTRHSRLHVGVDGELFTLSTPLTITSVPQSLLVKVAK
ncbi:MAG TPA: diacylglycerol kinase family protein [Thermoanaerobaculia bacterium]